MRKEYIGREGEQEEERSKEEPVCGLSCPCDVKEGWWVLQLFRPIFGLKFVIIFQANYGLGHQRSAAS